MNAIVPIPRVPVTCRLATLADVPFVDALQKLHGGQVGFMRTSWIEAKIKAGQVIVAEQSIQESPRRHGDTEARSSFDAGSASVPQCLRGELLGYCMSTDRYFKRDDVGIIYQLNVAPGAQRKLIGATLLKAVFDRAAYGCRLFCCWCAQDIAANRFWESMGFVPLAYRAGSESKARVHIFWQTRIREGDDETPWWFPAQTTGGAMNADRLVLPIPPGTHWRDAKPIVLPATDAPEQLGATTTKQIEGPKPKRERKPTAATAPAKPTPVRTLGAPRLVSASPPPPRVPEKLKRVKTPKKATCPERSRRKNDPKLVAAARELRDRWLEHVNAGQYLFEPAGKYDVSRAIEARPAMIALPAPLPHAA